MEEELVNRLSNVIPYKRHLCTEIADKLISIKIMERKETQRKILLLDILNVLIEINKQNSSDEISEYISNAATGEILDKKAKNEIIKLFKG